MDYTSRPMRKLVFQYLLLPALCLGLVPTRVSAQTLLVVNQGDSDLSIVDPVSAREVATIAEKTTGVHGHEIAVSADGRTAFVPIYGSSGVGKPGIDGHEMLVIDLPSRKIVGDIDFGHGIRPYLLRGMLLRHGSVYYMNSPRLGFSLAMLCAQLDDLSEELAMRGQRPVIL